MTQTKRKNPVARLFGRKGVTIPVVRMAGVIGTGTPFRPGLSLASVAGPLERAFSMKRAPAVAILVNSPGGSPVQSTLIMRRIRALAEEKEKTVLVFAEDVAASGGYLISLAGDEIFADPSSIIGSIGVISASFGFSEAISKLGIERRVHTAGTRKSILDPFRPEEEEDVAHLKSIQAEIHREFVDLVKERRGDRLSQDEDLFSGLFWPGRQAVERGLIDGIADLRGELRRRYGDDVRLRLINRKTGLFRRAGGHASLMAEAASGRGFGGRLADDFVAAVDERALWQRFGL